MKVFIPYVILLVVGLLMIYTAGSYEALSAGLAANYYVMRQGIFAVVGFIVLLLLLMMNIDVFRKNWILVILTAIVSLALGYVLIFGDIINGAKGWIDVGFASIQPIEFAKPVLILLIANYLSKYEDKINQNGLKGLIYGDGHIIAKNLVVPLICLAWLVIAFALPDIGGMALLASIVLFMLLGSGVKSKWTLAILGTAVVIYLGGVIFLSNVDLSQVAPDNYQLSRLTSFVDPFADELGDGMQLVNSFYALANGGMFGLGIGQSMQKTGYLPEAETDFILAIIGEEFGFFVLIAILAIYFFMTFYLYYRAQKMETSYLQLILIGVGTYFFAQATINLGAILGLLPITGITFPFMSYGGSSIFNTSIMIGLALSALRRDQRIKRGEVEPESIKKIKNS